VTSPDLVDRAAEVTALDAAWADALTGVPRTVLVAGEPGIGKTRLVDGLAERVEDAGGLVVTGGCPRLGNHALPLAPFRAVLSRLASVLGPATLLDLAGAGADLLAALVPELAADTAAAAPATHGDVIDVTARLLHRVARERPLAVVVEDLHWSDGSTRDLIGYLAQGWRSGRLLLVTTLRSEPEPDGAVQDLVQELLRLPGTELLELGRLSPAGVALVMAGILGAAPDPDLADRVARRSEGVPFLVEELTAAEVSGERPALEALRQVALRRTRLLPPAAAAVLRALAAAGGPVGQDSLAAVCDLPPAALDEALRLLVDTGLVAADRPSGRLDVRQALVREAIEGDLLPGESAELHGRWADLLDAAGDGDHRGVIEAAHHRWLAGDVERAYPATVRAAAAARTLPAYGEELLLLEHALDLRAMLPDFEQADDGGLLLDAGRAARLAGRYPRARDLLVRAVAVLDDDVDLLTQALWEQSLLARSLGDLPDVERALTAVLARLPEQSTILRARALNALLQLQLHRRDPAASETLSAAVSAAEDAGETVVAAHLRVTGAGSAADEAGDLDDAFRELGRADAVAQGADDVQLALRVSEARARVLLAAGRADEAEAAARDGLRLAARRGSPVLIVDYLVAALADALTWAGRWTEALTVLDDALRVDRPDLERAGLHARRARLLVDLGDPERAAPSVATARDRLRGAVAAADLQVLLATSEAELALAQGLPTAALETARLAYDSHGARAGAGVLRPLLHAACRAARPSGVADRRQPDSQAWLAAAARDLRGRRPVEPWDSVLAAEVSGADAGAWLAAVEALRQRAGPAALLMQTLLGAAVARLSGRPVTAEDRAAAADLVDKVLDLAGSAGAGPIAAAAHELAGRARLRVSAATPTRPSDGEGLTPRELEVLELLALGRSNAQIAAQLVISVKTVSVHVSHLLDKLGVSSRGEAAAAARSRGRGAT
jgi:DNA-binding CsgD family transcriptional regulator/tetratricopeptide (TPR) repeat protein